jgi:hypothetical protein
MVSDDGKLSCMIQEIVYNNGKCRLSWRKVNPIPETDDFFENVWAAYREHGNII